MKFCFELVANTLGVSIPSPYLSPNTKGLTILQGVNYASAGCGILNETTNNSVCDIVTSKDTTCFNNTVK